MASSREWEQEDLPVAPLLRGSQALPANLKLAQEAWPEQGDEGQEDGERQELLSFLGCRCVRFGSGLLVNVFSGIHKLLNHTYLLQL